jgi:hypothetical protein
MEGLLRILECGAEPRLVVREFAAGLSRLALALFNDSEAMRAFAADFLIRITEVQNCTLAAAFAALARVFVGADGNVKRYAELAESAVQSLAKKDAATIDDFEIVRGIVRPLIASKEKDVRKILAMFAREAEKRAATAKGDLIDRFIALNVEFDIALQ